MLRSGQMLLAQVSIFAFMANKTHASRSSFKIKNKLVFGSNFLVLAVGFSYIVNRLRFSLKYTVYESNRSL